MLTSAHITALNLQKAFFKFLHPFPFRWNSTKTGLEATRPRWKWIPWYCHMLYVVIYALAMIYSTLVYGLIQPRKDFKIFNVIIFVLSAVLLLYLLCVVAWAMVRNLQLTVIGFNQVLEMERRLVNAYQISSFNGTGMNTGTILIVFTFLTAQAPFLVLLVCMILDLDAYYFILEAEVLTDPMYRSMDEIVVAFLIRMVGLFPSTMEAARSTAVYFTSIIILFDSVKTIVHILTTIAKLHIRKRGHAGCREFRDIYIRFTILYKMLGPQMTQIVYVCLTSCFWLLVCTMWLNVQGFGTLPNLLWGCSVVISFLMVILHAFLIPKYTKIFVEFFSTLEIYQKQAHWLLIHKKTWHAKIMEKQAKALHPIKFKYGSFFYIDDEFIMDQFHLVMERTFDTIMLKDFNE